MDQAKEDLIAFCENPDPHPDISSNLPYDKERLDNLTEAFLAENSDEGLAEVLNAAGWRDNFDQFDENVEVDLALLAKKLRGRAEGFAQMTFCPECNNVLYPKENRQHRKLTMYCRNCHYEVDSVTSCISINHVQREIDPMSQVIADVLSDPTLPHTKVVGFDDVYCPKCGHDDAVFFQAQANREKEGMRLYYVCTACGNRWTKTHEELNEGLNEERYQAII